MSEPQRTSAPIFLSYAREDADAARRIAEALRGFGLEVWFDQSELRGGDSWDLKIRTQIRECVLFIPIVSANTQAREEGYFRREWLLAVERKRDMADTRAFIVPVIVDDTREGEANVPEAFLRAHVTRLPNGDPSAAFVDQVKRLIAPRPSGGGTRAANPIGAIPSPAPKRDLPWITLGLATAVIGLVAFVVLRPTSHAPSTAIPATTTISPAPAPVTGPAAAAPATNNADAHSLAVLPFVDMSQAKDQEYFSDGLAEELLDLLAKVPGLQVTSRTSAFAYKGKEVSLAQIARELNVANILEGSVRKSGTHLRITAQLIDARTDKHIWSETYDRSLDDIFAVQDEISSAVVGQLKISLLGAAPKAKAADPKAYALFLQARQLSRQYSVESLAQAEALILQAVAIDPNLSAAWSTLANIYMLQADFGRRPNVEGYTLARDAANKALAADPNFALGHAQLGSVQAAFDRDIPGAARSFQRALELEPANTEIITEAMRFLRGLGRYDLVIRMGEYVVAHDPLNALAQATLSGAYTRAGRLDDAIASCRTSLRLAPDRSLGHWTLGAIYLQKGDPQAALTEMQLEPDGSWHLDGLVLTYFALGRKAESDAVLKEFIAKYEKESSWNIAYDYAFRGEADKAFEWLDKAIEYRDPGVSLTQVQWLFHNVENDPRWIPFLRRIGHAPEQLAKITFDVRLPEK